MKPSFSQNQKASENVRLGGVRESDASKVIPSRQRITQGQNLDAVRLEGTRGVCRIPTVRLSRIRLPHVNGLRDRDARQLSQTNQAATPPSFAPPSNRVS